MPTVISVFCDVIFPPGRYNNAGLRHFGLDLHLLLPDGRLSGSIGKTLLGGENEKKF